MKKTIISALACSALLIGCSKDLDQNPSTSLRRNVAITNPDLLQTATRGVYSTLVSRWGYAGDIAIYADGKGGDIKPIEAAYNHFIPVIGLLTTEDSGVSAGAFRVFAQTAARVNLIFEDLNIPEASLTATDKDALGQLYALRGLSHFEFARLFCQLPAIAKDLDAPNSGGIILTEVYPANHKFGRATLRESYTQAIADLTKALETIKKDRTEGSTLLNYWSVAALLSRVYLYNLDYDNAYKWAREVIENSPYSLYSRENYLAAWRKVGTEESLFEVAVTDKTIPSNTLGVYTDPEGFVEGALAPAFAQHLLDQVGDIRSELVEPVYKKGVLKGHTLRKYRGREGSSNTNVNNFKVIRLSEVYLIAAEALLRGATQTGGKSAVDYYNDLRSNRIEGYTPATDVTLEDILAERRLELFHEGHRLFDLVRYKKDVYNPFTEGTYKYDDPKLLIDFPRRELNISLGKLVQNPKD